MANDKKSHSSGNRSRKKSRKSARSKDNGMMTKVWGPAGWVFLHSCAMGYPIKIDKKDKEHRKRKRETKKFFESVGYVFPCRYCRESYMLFIKEAPLAGHLDTRQNLCRWLYRIHNKVNKKLGVPKCKSFGLPQQKTVFYKGFLCCDKTEVKHKLIIQSHLEVLGICFRH